MQQRMIYHKAPGKIEYQTKYILLLTLTEDFCDVRYGYIGDKNTAILFRI